MIEALFNGSSANESITIHHKQLEPILTSTATIKQSQDSLVILGIVVLLD
jgi:hypothetical protein